MKRVSEEDLLGYAMGALDADEHQRIDALVQSDEATLQSLRELRARIQPLEFLSAPERPRAGLARRACECIAAVPLESAAMESSRKASKSSQRLPATSWFSPRRESPEATDTPSVMNFAVFAASLLLLAAIALPAIQASRFNSRLIACQNNLRTVGASLVDYSWDHGGRHLPIPVGEDNLGFAGVYGPQLIDMGLIDNPAIMLCAGRQTTQTESHPVVPTLAQLRAASDEQLFQMQQKAGGDFAFTLGQVFQNEYSAPRNLSRPDFALLGDLPGADQYLRRSNSHGRYGQNIFFEDGHVDFLVSPFVDGASIYENDLGVVAPGVHENDSVLAPSATPVFQPKFRISH